MSRLQFYIWQGLYKLSNWPKAKKKKKKEAAEDARQEIAQMNERLKNALNEAEKARREAEKQKAKTEAVAYRVQLMLANEHSNRNDVRASDIFLDQCAKGLRNLEWNLIKQKNHDEYLTIEHPAQACDFSSDNNWLALGVDNKLELWDLTKLDAPRRLKTFTVLTKRNNKTAEIVCCRFSPDNRRILFGDNHGKIRLIQVDSFTDPLIWDTGSMIRCCAFRPRSEMFATGDIGSMLCFWDHKHKHPVQEYRYIYLGMPDAKAIRGCAFSPDGRWLAFCCADLALWDVKNRCMAKCKFVFSRQISRLYL